MKLEITLIVLAVILILTSLIFSSPYVELDSYDKAWEVEYYNSQTMTIKFGVSVITVDNYWGLEKHINNQMKYGKIILMTGGYGGDSNAVHYLLSLLAQHNKQITVHINAPAYSAHALLSCMGDKYIISPGVLLMFHGVQGVKPHYAKIINKLRVGPLLTAYCSHILTAEEIEYISTTGGEVWLSQSELEKRLKDRLVRE